MDPVTCEVAGIQPQRVLAIDEIVEVSSSGKKPWRIKRCKGGYYTCTCAVFIAVSQTPVTHRTCAHLRKLFGEEYESARLKIRGSGSRLFSSRSSDNKRKRQSDSDFAASFAGTSDSVARASSSVQRKLSGRSSQVVGEGYDRDPFMGETTFNGRAIRKNFDPNSAVAIMLSTTWDSGTMDPTGWWMSEKLDGVRAYWTGERLISRTNKDWGPPKWFLDKLPKGFALDGELWRERDGFEELSGICQRADTDGWNTVNFFVFDAPNCQLPFEERLKAAQQRCPDGEMTPDEALRGRFGGRVATLPMTLCQGQTHLEQYMGEILKQGGEGVMLRRRNSPYERKRSPHSRKVKKWYDGEGVVVGFARGEGRYQGLIGSIGLLMASGAIFTVGTGFPETLRKGDFLPQRGSLVRYRCGGVTADGVPRFPVYVGPVYDRSHPRDPDVPTTAVRKRRREEVIEEETARNALIEGLQWDAAH